VQRTDRRRHSVKIKSLVSLLIRWVCPVVLTIAVAAKLFELDRFAESLDTFALVDQRLAGIALVAVPALEIVPLTLCVFGRFRAANGVVVALLAVFTGVVVIHWLANTEPTCECFGQWVSYRAAEHRYAFYLARNAVILVAATAATVAIGAPATSTGRRLPDRSVVDAV
jgi:hypothetical protein